MPSDDEHLDHAALHDDVGAVHLDRGVLRCHGPEAASYLQGQLTQDIEALAVGEAAWTLLLQPAGKVVAWLRVSREAPDAFVLDAEAGALDAVVARLERFKLRTRFELERLAWRCLALRGPRASELALAAEAIGEGTAVLRVPWPGGPVADLLGPAPCAPGGVRTCSADAYEALRIEHGVPATGAELTEATIPAEAGPWVIASSVSFTKGCYTGQELVVRIHSRGNNVPRPVRGLVVHDGSVPALGTELQSADGKVVGRVTSAAWSARKDAAVALAVLARSVDVGAVLSYPGTGAGGTVAATVVSLPMS